jgi:APA family basic amino acid/polyamine antiporter
MGLFHSIITSLGATIGIEFFVLLDYAADLAGPAVILSLVFSGIINLLIMLNYVELSSSICRVGAEYTFTKVAFGGFICFLSGWLRWLSSVFTTTLSAIGLAQVVNFYVPKLSMPLVAVVLISIFAVISIKGRKFANLVTVVLFITVFVVLSILGGIRGLDLGIFIPFMPKGFYPGVMAGAMYSFNMFVGMRAIATESTEVKDPGKILPKALLISTFVTLIIYCSLAFIAVGTIATDSGYSGPLLILVGRNIAGTLGEALVVIAWTLAALMSLATSLSVQKSIFIALSRDGYLPRAIFYRAEGWLTKHIAHITGPILAIFFAATGVIIFVGYAGGFASLIVFALVNMSLIKLRLDKPELDRPFKTPLYPYSPIFGILIALALMIFIEGSAVVLVLDFILISIMLYHLKMMGFHRLRLAIGGINIGVGFFLIMILSLYRIGIISFSLRPPEEMALTIIGYILGATFLIAGVLNLIKSKEQVTLTTEIPSSK